MGSVSDRNKRTVEAFYEAEIDRDLATWSNLWHPNGSLSFWLNEMKETIRGRDTLVELEAEKFNKFTEFAFSMEVAADPLEDDSMVLARLRIRPESAPASAFHYWLLFHFDDEGLIVGLEEIADTTPPAGVQL